MGTKDLAPAKSSDEEYNWSLPRIAEQVTINVVSFIAIGTLGILAGFVYSAILLVQSLLRVPSEISGLLAFVVFGMLLMLSIICLALYIGMRKANPLALILTMLFVLVVPSIAKWIGKQHISPEMEEKHE